MAKNAQTTTNSHNFKIVLLGEGHVGKTSLILRYVENKFNREQISTAQASFLEKKLNIGGKRINLAIWDTAGQEIFHALGPIYYRDSNGAILVYDVTDNSSFQKVKCWVKELRKMLGTNVCLAIAGNKIDLEKNRHVLIEEAETYADQVGATHFHTSAKLNQGIEELFLTLTQNMIQHSEQNLENSGSLNRQNSTRRNVLIIDDEQIGTPNKNCCSNS